jgi:hypothetical protein
LGSCQSRRDSKSAATASLAPKPEVGTKHREKGVRYLFHDDARDSLRLRRLICGKALPFRKACLLKDLLPAGWKAQPSSQRGGGEGKHCLESQRLSAHRGGRAAGWRRHCPSCLRHAHRAIAAMGEKKTQHRARSAVGPQPNADSLLRCAPLRRKSRHSRESGNPVPADMDPRLRGGDVLTFIPAGGPQAHVHSE